MVTCIEAVSVTVVLSLGILTDSYIDIFLLLSYYPSATALQPF